MDVAYEDGLAATDRLLADTWLPNLVQQAEVRDHADEEGHGT
jgi:hypothetical protein